ncbi:hypothetical protein Halru_0370 [Halovivax ruber XH-70]|uniref:Uncharacterized protein n=1 Tax=Halovivax ruber (strain DSM 18193 / JCM 13892 / XH-70) TaxID=797302 RepID=L0I884_HALRX|nr:hypothetical protein Halru_0370 [Halovivax ruber XH-70]
MTTWRGREGGGVNTRRSLSLGLAAACFLWAIAVIGFALDTYTPLPSMAGLEPIVTAGAVVAILVGIGVGLRDGYRWIVD